MAQNFIPRGSRTVDVQPLPDSMWQRYSNRPGLLSTLARAYKFYDDLSPEGKQRIAKLFEGKKEPSALERLRALKVDPTPPNEPEYSADADPAEQAQAAEQARIAKERAAKELAAEQARANEELADYAQSPYGEDTPGQSPVELSRNFTGEPAPLQMRGQANLGMGPLTRGEKFAEQIMDDKEKMRDLSTDEYVDLAIKKIMGQYQ